MVRRFFDDDVAIYFDNNVDQSATWMNKYMGDVWRYTKKVYGSFGGANDDSHLYALFHAGRYSGGHPSTYFDDSHDFRNVIDCGLNNMDAWKNPDYAIPVHEVAHIVESK